MTSKTRRGVMAFENNEPTDLPPVDPALAETPPAETPPADTPPAETPPADTPPADAVLDAPLDAPVLDAPVLDAATPPVVDPAIPPVDGEAPVDAVPPADGDTPPAETPPAETPPGDAVTVDIDLMVEADEPEAEEDMAELVETTDEVAATEGDIEEAVSAADAIEQITDQMQESVDTGDGLTPATAETLRVAVEHLQTRLGYHGKNIFPAMETFGGKMSRKEATIAAIASNRAMVLEARQAIAIAQEGLGGKMANAWKLLWQNEKKLMKRLTSVSAAYDSGTPKTDAMKNPGWGKALNHSAKPMLFAKDVQADLEFLQKQMDSDKLADIATKVGEAVNKLTSTIRKSIFVTDQESIHRIERTQTEITSLLAAVDKELPPRRDNNADSQFAPVGAADKKKMVASLTDLLSNAKLASALDRLDTAVSSFETEWIQRASIRLAGAFAKDMRATHNAAVDARKVSKLIADLLRKNIVYCHSSISYIAASSGKKES